MKLMFKEYSISVMQDNCPFFGILWIVFLEEWFSEVGINICEILEFS